MYFLFFDDSNHCYILMFSNVQFIAFTIATGVSLVYATAPTIAASCSGTAMEVELAGLQNQKVQYCSRTVDIGVLSNQIENGELLTYYFQRSDINPIDYSRDVTDDSSFMVMGCMPNQNVLPISAWFEYTNGVFEEDLARVLHVKGLQKEHQTPEQFCTGNTISCVRAWSEIFPLRHVSSTNSNATVSPFSTLISDLAKLKNLHLEWLCVPAATRDTLYPLVTFSDLSFSALIETTDFDTVDSILDRDQPSPTDAAESNLGSRNLILNTVDYCPTGTAYIEPLMLTDGANCASDVSVDLTSNGKNACESASKASGTALTCSISLPAQIPDGEGAIRVPGCNRRRASGIGRCVMTDKWQRTAYSKLRDYVATKSQDSGARLITYTPVDARHFSTCTFMNPYYFTKPQEAFTKREICCFMESVGITGACGHTGDDVTATVPYYTATEGVADTATRGDSIEKFILSMSAINYRCIVEPFVDYSTDLKARADNLPTFGTIDQTFLQQTHTKVINNQLTLVDIFGDFHDVSETTTTTKSPLDAGSVSDSLAKSTAFYHYALRTNPELTYCPIKTQPIQGGSTNATAAASTNSTAASTTDDNATEDDDESTTNTDSTTNTNSTSSTPEEGVTSDEQTSSEVNTSENSEDEDSTTTAAVSADGGITV